MYGSVYECDHPVYSECTLFKMDNLGLAIIQQRYDQATKQTWWTKVDPWLTDELYLHDKFGEYFKERSGPSFNGVYPTVTIRQIMWALKMKPLPKERWETCFDRRSI